MNDTQALQMLRAYHEGGYAVIAFQCQALSRAPGYFVAIEQTGALGGATPINPYADLATMIRILYAGYHAEQEFCRVYAWEVGDLLGAHAQHDFEQIHARVRQVVGAVDVVAYAAPDHEWTAKQIRQPNVWYAIRKLAYELYRRTTVDAHQAADEVETALRAYQRRRPTHALG